MRVLETDRLLLRPFTMDDVDPSYEMNLHPEVSRYTGDGGVQSRESVHTRIEQDVLGDYQRHGYGRHAVVHKADDRFIGFCGLKYLTDLEETDLGYRFHPDYWGKGIATEASRAAIDFGFESLQLKQIVGLVMPDNVASVRVLEKVGMVFLEEIEEDGERVLKYGLSQ